MDKIELLAEITGNETGYYVEGYEEDFYKSYKLLESIKELLGTAAIERIYMLDDEEGREFRAILRYLLGGNK